MRIVAGMELRSRPGILLRGASTFGLVAWAGALFALTRLPRVELETWLSALFMAFLFTALLASQNTSEIRTTDQALVARTFFRMVRCDWRGVGRARPTAFLPFLTIWTVPTRAGSVAFSSLWKNHRELLAAIEQRARPPGAA